MDLLSSAEKLPAATGHAVTLCPVHGVRALRRHTEDVGTGAGAGGR
jgi:hypothetical protein